MSLVELLNLTFERELAAAGLKCQIRLTKLFFNEPRRSPEASRAGRAGLCQCGTPA
jgi:hypothetical protein